MQATIEIDLGLLADEWEAVSFRPPKTGESFIKSQDAVVLKAARDFSSGELRLIVRRKWVFPSWLKARWYSENASGVQWVCLDGQKPIVVNGGWSGTGIWVQLHPGLVDVPKIDGDWRQSLRENPNWKASQE